MPWPDDVFGSTPSEDPSNALTPPSDADPGMSEHDQALAQLRADRKLAQLLDSQAAERASASMDPRALHPIPDPVISPEHLWYLMNPTPLHQPSFGERAADGALDVAGKIWNSPNTILGTAYGGLGYAAGLLGGGGPHIQFGHNGIEFTNNPLVNGHSAFTLGNAISYGKDAGPEQWGAYNDPNVKNWAT